MINNMQTYLDIAQESSTGYYKVQSDPDADRFKYCLNQ